MGRYSAAIAWMERRAPGSSPRPRVTRRLARSVLGAAAWAAAGRRERAAFKLLDGAVVLAEGAGYLRSNNAIPLANPRAFAGVVVAEFPTRASAELAHAAGPEVVVEAARRPERPDREAASGLRARFEEDDGILRRALAFVIVGLRTPPAAAAPALRFWRAGVREIHNDPQSRQRAEQLARVVRWRAR
jgi:hypothetical protein